MRRLFVPAALLGALLLGGCYTTKMYSPDLASAKSGPTVRTMTLSLFWGIVPMGKASLDSCGNAGIKSIKTNISGIGLIVNWLTGGIVTPMHVKMTCAEGGTAADAELPPLE